MMLMEHASEADIVKHFLKQAGNARLDINAFPHLSRDIEMLKDYLTNALKQRVAGANILFYGPPGTGKSELAKALVNHIGSELYEVNYSDEEGDPIRGKDRLRAYNLCQKLLAKRENAVLMFDEIEDVFGHQSSLLALFGISEGLPSSGGKAWINRSLERNGTPAIWITNNPHIDTAYLRRFDYSVRFPNPPPQVRLAIARHHLQGFEANPEWLAQIPTLEHASPAQIERAAHVARLASGENAEKARERFVQVLDRSATLLEQKRQPARNPLYTGYDRNLINTDVDIDKLIASLQQRPRGSFCFYGPPGTGNPGSTVTLATP
jgi:SpoVK/Ycf46/Vps4 family AAA+-type ATPase